MTTVRGLVKYWLYNSVPGVAGRYPYYGTAVHFPRGSQLVRALCSHGVFEPEIAARMVRLTRPATTVFDVGANLGVMSVPVLRECATCQVVSYEPSPSSLPFLERTRAESAHRDRWTVVGKALADQPGTLDFFVGGPADALYDGLQSGGAMAGSRTVRVEVTTLDDEWRRLGRPEVSLLKIDVEGAEGLVLAGASAMLEATPPAILVEWHEPYLARFKTMPAELLRLASRFNYRIFSIPFAVPVDDSRALQAQMIDCQNFLLLR